MLELPACISYLYLTLIKTQKQSKWESSIPQDILEFQSVLFSLVKVLFLQWKSQTRYSDLFYSETLNSFILRMLKQNVILNHKSKELHANTMRPYKLMVKQNEIRCFTLFKTQCFNMTESKQKVKHDSIWYFSIHLRMKTGMCLF